MEKDNQQTQNMNLKDHENAALASICDDIRENVEVESPKPHESKDNSKKKNAKKAVKLGLMLIAFVGVLVLGLWLGGFFKDEDPKADPNDQEKFVLAGGGKYDPGKYKNVKLKDHVAIFGVQNLKLKAGVTHQEHCGIIQNPKGNTSFMKASLRLKTGEVLWETGNALLEPGLAYNEIELKRPLKKGKYKASIVYECFSVKDLAKQNGSNVDITLIVE